MPSEKYSFCASSLMLTKGRTATEVRGSSGTGSGSGTITGDSSFTEAGADISSVAESGPESRLPMYRSISSTATTATSAAMIMRSSLRALVCLMPSGVISKAQAKNTASGKPMIRRNATAVGNHSGKRRAGENVSVTCMISHPTTV